MSQEFVNRRSIQWFPGHMAKTLRLIEADLKNVDVVLQLLDARIPQSSLNPELQQLTAGKPRLYVLNKADLADDALTRAWVDYFHREGAGCVAISAKQKGSAAKVRTAIGRARAWPAPAPGSWWWVFPMWENLLLSTALRAAPAQRRRTSRASRAASNG